MSEIRRYISEFYDKCRTRYCPVRNGQCVADDCICFLLEKSDYMTAMAKYVKLTGHCTHHDINRDIATDKYKGE